MLLDRIESRTTNDYGKTREERALILGTSRRSSRCCARRARTSSTPGNPLDDLVVKLVEIGGDSTA